MSIGSVILAGGASRRMGADKAAQPWNGRRAIDHVHDLASAAGAEMVVVAGGDYGLPFVPDPTGPHGPAAGIATGCAYLRAAGLERALILAVDAPSIKLGDIAPLLEALSPGACYRGLPLPMMLEIARLPSELGPEWSLRGLVEQIGLHILEPPPEAQIRLRGANTPAELAALKRLAPQI